MRIGIFGGTFDPVHFGHLLSAELCREQCELDRVQFVPAAVPPHKQTRELSPDRQRVEMLQLATGGHPAFEVSTIEIDRGGVTYTYETLEAIHAERPDDELFFLMGADSLRDLPTWRRPERICQLAIPVAVARPGAPPPKFEALAPLVSPQRLAEIRRFSVRTPQLELSSTEIRRRTAAGQSIRFQTPAAVEKYIESQRLYR